MKRNIEILVLSDVHLGSYGCRANLLIDYLRSITPEVIVLNGDFFDIWQFKKSYFPIEHAQIIQKMIKFAAHGTKIYYLTGNHDDALRNYADFNTGMFHLRNQLELQLDGKRYWFFHGDVFDSSINFAPFIARLGAVGYDWLIWLNRTINKIRARFGHEPLSFSQKIKSNVKKSVGDFERKAIDLAAKKGFDYVVCGHVHKAKIEEFDTPNGKVTYLNSGDWVESLTALEYSHGEWTIHKHEDFDYNIVSPRLTLSKNVIMEILDAVPNHNKIVQDAVVNVDKKEP